MLEPEKQVKNLFFLIENCTTCQILYIKIYTLSDFELESNYVSDFERKFAFKNFFWIILLRKNDILIFCAVSKSIIMI